MATISPISTLAMRTMITHGGYQYRVRLISLPLVGALHFKQRSGNTEPFFTETKTLSERQRLPIAAGGAPSLIRCRNFGLQAAQTHEPWTCTISFTENGRPHSQHGSTCCIFCMNRGLQVAQIQEFCTRTSSLGAKLRPHSEQVVPGAEPTM